MNSLLSALYNKEVTNGSCDFYLPKGPQFVVFLNERNLTFNLLDPNQIRLTLCYTNYKNGDISLFARESVICLLPPGKGIILPVPEMLLILQCKIPFKLQLDRFSAQKYMFWNVVENMVEKVNVNSSCDFSNR